MLSRKNSRGRRPGGSRGGSNRSQVERLVDIMFSAAVPAASMDKMRWWLVDSDKEDEKSDALYGKFMEIFTFNSEPVLAPQLWPALARRLGLDENPVAVALDPLAPQVAEASPATGRALRKLSFRRLAPRVAAVLLPALVAVGAALWVVDRRSQEALVEISVPQGVLRIITLPDGSRIEAEEGAIISYNKKGFADNRLVQLSGEALFDVVGATGENGEAAPFTVEAENLTVNVLGTIFRLAEGVAGSDAAAVSLYKGSVGVSIEPSMEQQTGAEADMKILAAGERLRVDTSTGEHTTELIPASEMAALGIMPLLRFDEATLGNLIMALEMNHGVEFDVADGIDTAKGRYSANFEELTLDEVLRMLSKIDINLSFKRDGNRVDVNRK